MTFSSLISFSWNGSTVATTRASGAVWTVADYTLPDFSVRPRVAALDLHDAEWETYRALPEKVGAWRMVIHADVTGAVASSNEGTLIDCWAEAAAFWSPIAGAGYLGVSRPTRAAATVSRKLWANVQRVPVFTLQMQEPRGDTGSGAYDPDGSPYFVYVVEGDTRFPYWMGSTLLDDDISSAAAELAISGSTDTVTINNPGVRWVGLKLTVKAGSVSGSVDGFTVTNNTNGTFVAITNAAHLVAGEYIDWHATAPITHPLPGSDMSSAWRYGVLGNNLRIDPGDNALQVVRTAGAGTCTLELDWPSYFMGI